MTSTLLRCLPDAVDRARTVDEIAAATLPLLILDGDSAAMLYLVTADGASLRLLAASGFAARPDLREALPAGEGLIGHAAARVEGLVAGMDDARALFASPAVAASVRSAAAAPVRAGGTLAGILTLARRRSDGLGAAERALLGATAALVGSALERLRQAALLARADERLFELGKLAAVGQLVAGVAHEVNNPLTTILGHAQLLLTGPDLDENLRQRLQLVASEGIRAARLIQNLLAFARERPSDRRPCSLADQARRVLALKAHQLYQDSVRVVTDFGDCPAVRADEREIQHALLALVHRAHLALRRQADARVLTVRTRSVRGEVWLDVLDTGPALAADALPGLTSPLEAPPAQGLAVAHRIVTAHGGRLRAGAPRDGGTLLSIVLPAEVPAGE